MVLDVNATVKLLVKFVETVQKYYRSNLLTIHRLEDDKRSSSLTVGRVIRVCVDCINL